MSLLEKVNNPPTVNAEREPQPRGNLENIREEGRGYVNAGLEAIDRGIAVTEDNARFLFNVRQQSGQ
jgi:hypothetical protein